MAFTKRESINNIELSGFWTRTQGSVLAGLLRKHVPNDKDKKKNPRPFYIIQVVENKETGPLSAILATEDEEGKEVERIVKTGDFVGVSACYAIASVIDNEADLEKMVRFTVIGEAVNPHGGKPMRLIEVEVED
jgi:hypothetical protein